ncbi:MAG: hypothetical protein ACKVQC_04950 [Elusimicrobiota bacterium]
MSSDQALERTSNGKYWAAFLFFLLLIAASLIFFQEKREISNKTSFSISDRGQQVDWFYLFKIPEIPLNDPDRTLVLSHLKLWIKFLKNADFTFMSLSDVLSRQSQGKNVPVKSVVFYFSPGFRQSFDAIKPLIKELDMPITWLTDQAGLENKDIRFINSHDIEVLKKTSHLWDFGFFNSEKKNFSLFSPRIELTGAPFHGTISEDENTALTTLNASSSFQAFAINPNWTGQDLLNYIYRHRQIDGPSYLSLLNMSNKPIPVSYPDAHAKQSDFFFDLSSRLDNRVHQVAWSATKNIHDYQLDLSVQEYFGEIWLTLRGNEGKGESVRLGFSDDFIIFDQEDSQFRHHRQTFPWKRTKAFSARVQIKANKLVFSVNEGPLSRVYDLSSTANIFEPVSLMVFERVRGVAWANGVQLKITPINNSSESL